MHRHLERALHGLETATANFPPDAMSRAANGKWSAANIIEHLARTFGSTHRLLEKQRAAGLPRVPTPNFRERLLQLIVIHIGYLPSGRKAPDFTIPSGLPAADALQQFRRNIVLMDESIARCAQRTRGRIAVHPVLGPLTANQWRKFHWIHTRHHLRQIQKLVRAAAPLTNSAIGNS